MRDDTSADYAILEQSAFVLPETMSISALGERCRMEIESSDDEERRSGRYCVELFRRAVFQCSLPAQEIFQQCFAPMVRTWLGRYPDKDVVCCTKSEEQYVALTFAQFWQCATQRGLEVTTLAVVLRYLYICAHNVVHEPVQRPARRSGGSIARRDAEELWQTINELLPEARDRRLAYLLFHCGLKPREICTSYEQEFSDLREIYSLYQEVTERLACNKVLAEFECVAGE